MSLIVMVCGHGHHCWTPSQLRDVTCHMGSQCYLPPDTSERVPP